MFGAILERKLPSFNSHYATQLDLLRCHAHLQCSHHCR